MNVECFGNGPIFRVLYRDEQPTFDKRYRRGPLFFCPYKGVTVPRHEGVHHIVWGTLPLNFLLRQWYSYLVSYHHRRRAGTTTREDLVAFPTP